MWLAPQKIKDNSLETINKAFVFYLPFILFYLLISSYSIVPKASNKFILLFVIR